MSNLPVSGLGFPRQPFISLASLSSGAILSSPGVATIRGLELNRNWNVQQGWGYSGATSVFIGQALQTFSVDFKFWLREQLVAWDLFSKVFLQAPRNGEVTTLGIAHPIVNGSPHNIGAVVVTKVSGLEQSDTGLWTTSVDFLEFRKPLPAVARPISAIPAHSSPQPSAQSQMEVEMIKVGQQIDKLEKLAK